ncbi:uncharacterized protein LOC130647724 [Hydractinia symbiolongicarpus]|uniref:uncharacterized protein LOC130647724 n=1 Tax=Hydractinia symbiolongicarpus TaxID=13093 RepID=UPI00254C83E6|nr:uncharacterized protein LOC130647724 [Hydractinia symbiolongicarpus]
MKNLCILLFLVVSCLMVIHGTRKTGRCWIAKRSSGYSVVCDSSRFPRSKVSEKKTPVKPAKERTRRRKIRLTIQCQEQATPWTSESNILTALSTLFTIKCPEATFLRETAVKRNETQLRMQYKCCSLK